MSECVFDVREGSPYTASGLSGWQPWAMSGAGIAQRMVSRYRRMGAKDRVLPRGYVSPRYSVRGEEYLPQL